jgi:hypothetical protein
MKKEQKEKEDKFYDFCMKHHTCNGCTREIICFPEDKNKCRNNENYKSKPTKDFTKAILSGKERRIKIEL